MSFTKEDYLAWRKDPVTEGFQEEVMELLDTLVAQLTNQAGLDALADRKAVGKVEGLKFLFDWVPVVVDEDEPKDEENPDES